MSSTRGLPTHRLGRTSLELSRVGFGAWAIGGGDWAFGWGQQDDHDSLAAMRHALDLGINWIDTAAVYGLGHSEELVGRLLREIPRADRPLVFTKCGLVWDPAQRMTDARRVLAPDSIRRECEASLRRLGVERIDLYQFHWPDETGVPVEESWNVMAALADEGKVGAIGVSNFDVALLERCEAIRHVDSLQPPFSLIRRNSAAELLPWCAHHQTGVIVYSPMQSGILTGKFGQAWVDGLDEGDWRRRSKEFQPPQLERNVALRDALLPIARRHGVDVTAVAVAWTLCWEGVTAAIVGARRPSQVDGWAEAARLQLSADDLDAITRALEQTGAGTGPVSGAAQHHA